MTMQTDGGYSASCPCCGYEHDFPNRREMEAAFESWLAALHQYVRMERRIGRKAMKEMT